jgi:DNA-binding transcriptional LysR family regulator
MKIDERHLVQLAAVIETGGVTEGAAMLGMTQPAVSRTLSMLEKRIGEPLFLPGKRPLQPTTLGQQLGIQGKSILAASRKAVEIVRSFQSGSSGSVKVGGVPFFMDAVISHMVATFQTKEPGILIEQSYGNMPDLMTQLDSSQIDMAITPIGSSELKPEFEFESILPGRNVLTCGVGHPLLRKRRVTTEDIVNYPWVAPLPGSPLVLDLHNILLTLGINELAIRYSGGSLLSVVNFIAATDALAILPHSVAFSFRKENKISIVPIEIPQPERTLGIITRRNRTYSNPACRKFQHHVVGEFADLRKMIERHESSIHWGQGPFLPERERAG